MWRTVAKHCWQPNTRAVLFSELAAKAVSALLHQQLQHTARIDAMHCAALAREIAPSPTHIWLRCNLIEEATPVSPRARHIRRSEDTSTAQTEGLHPDGKGIVVLWQRPRIVLAGQCVVDGVTAFGWVSELKVGATGRDLQQQQHRGQTSCKLQTISPALEPQSHHQNAALRKCAP